MDSHILHISRNGQDRAVRIQQPEQVLLGRPDQQTAG
jgi:hypothetical protein